MCAVNPRRFLTIWLFSAITLLYVLNQAAVAAVSICPHTCHQDGSRLHPSLIDWKYLSLPTHVWVETGFGRNNKQSFSSRDLLHMLLTGHFNKLFWWTTSSSDRGFWTGGDQNCNTFWHGSDDSDMSITFVGWMLVPRPQGSNVWPRIAAETQSRRSPKSQERRV